MVLQQKSFLANGTKDRIKVLYAQAIEIKWIYRETHDVFIHAQASPWLIISDMVKELYRLTCPGENLSQFKFLRASSSTAEPGSKEKLYRRVAALNPFASKGIESYSQRWFQSYTLTDDDPKVREELLSVDAYFYNYMSYESAMFFLSNNSNIISDPQIIERIAKNIITSLYPKINPGKLSGYIQLVRNVVKSKSFPCGNLFVICIPKTSSKKVAYRSHPYGRTCECHSSEEERSILEKLQAGIFDAGTKCTKNLQFPVPQYRLYLPEIEPGKGQKIFLLTPLAHADRKEIKNSIRQIAERIHQENIA